MADIITVANQKGGVGKTTSAVNIAAALAAIGFRTLLIDLDPQANSTTAFGALKNQNAYDFLIKNLDLAQAVKKTLIPDLSLIPANINLIGAEVELVNINQRENVLRNALNNADKTFDYVIIDCPPAMGLLTLNALIASKYVLIPLQCEYYALEGLSYLLQSIQKINNNFKVQVKILGILLTMYDKRSSLCLHVANDVRYHLKDLVFNTSIPRNVKIAEAPSHGKPGIIYDMKASASIAYLETTKEIIQRVKL